MSLSPLTDPVISDSNVFLFLEVIPLGGAKIAGVKHL
jgi:hypothetical protein